MKKYFAFFAIVALALAGCKNEPDPIKVASVNIDKATMSISVGEKQTLTATVLPANADNKNYSWSSSAPAVASVNATTGEVEGKAAGSATITVTTEEGGKTDECVVTVNAVPGKVAITSTLSLTDRNTISASSALDPETGLPVITLAVKAEAEKGIGALKLSLTTDNQIIAGALAQFGAAGEMNLANPTPEQAAALSGLLHLPVGADVAGKTSLDLDFVAIMPLIFGMKMSAEVFDIAITVEDIEGTPKTGILKLSFDYDITEPSATITGEGFDIDQVLEIPASAQATTPVILNVAAQPAIETFLVEITSSSPAFTGALALMGLDGEFDLANPTEAQVAALSSPAITMIGGLPYGDQVKGHTSLPFNLTGFVPMIFRATGGDVTADFKITVNGETKTLSLSLVNDIPAAR